MWAQIKLYRWLLIVILMAVQAIGIIVLYNMYSNASEDRADLTEKVTTLENQYGQYAFDLNKAKADLEALRTDLDGISTQTEQLQTKLGVIPKPTANGANSKDIQTQANTVSKDAFGRVK